MIESVAEKLVTELASGGLRKWGPPALGFWFFGYFALTLGDKVTWASWGLRDLIDLNLPVLYRVESVSEIVEGDLALQVTRLLGCALLVVTSGWLANQFTLPVLQLAEGYWPRPFTRLADWKAERCSVRREKYLDELRVLDAKYVKHSQSERRRSIELDFLVSSCLPEGYALPTKLGNILRSSEQYPMKRYGLEMFVCWPRLWMVIPESAREINLSARQRLDQATLFAMWSCLLLVWAWWTWVAIPLAAIGVYAGHKKMLSSASLYADSLRALFDLYRFSLYDALRWPNPINPKQEVFLGRELTQYLYRGSGKPRPEFKSPK